MSTIIIKDRIGRIRRKTLSSFSRISAQKAIKYINKNVPPKGMAIIKNKSHKTKILYHSLFVYYVGKEKF